MTEHEDKKSREIPPNYLVFGAFIGISGLSLMAGFTYRISSFKKVNPLPFMQAINQDKTTHESGIHFAARALGVATIITTSSLGALSLCTWYIINPVDRNDFNERIRNAFPYRWKIKSSDNRSEIRTSEELSSLINDSVKNK
ncbi:unnamed protein product [Schistosoma haematobium]|nr:unnamed protein product [Schistosoma haematobium]CAH8443984.1 unnamed protein product [Schistosoma haematobium]